MKLTIVIPTFNRPHLVKELVDRLKAADHETIVVDDCSSARLSIEDARVIRNSKNMGASYSNNLGASFASNEWIFFLNDDMLPQDGFFQSLDQLTHVADVIGFRLVGDGVTKTQTAFNRSANILFGVDIPRTSGYCIFVPSAMLIKKDWFFRVGGFDVRTYIGNGFREESDLQMRLHQIGARIYYASNLLITHKRSRGGYDKREMMSKSGHYYVRNHTIFVLRHYGLRGVVMITGFSLLMLIKGVGIRALVRGLATGLLEK